MFTLYRIALASAPKPYRIGLIFTRVKNGNLGKISVTERSCTAPVLKVGSHMLDKCSYYTGGLFVSAAKAIQCKHSLKDAAWHPKRYSKSFINESFIYDYETRNESTLPRTTLVNESGKYGKTTAVLCEHTYDNESSDTVRWLGTILQRVFAPNQEPAFAEQLGNGLVTLSTQWLCRPCLCLKTFVVPFLLTWLTVPRLPREWFCFCEEKVLNCPWSYDKENVYPQYQSLWVRNH